LKSVLAAIDLNNQIRIEADKINDVTADRMLSLELGAFDLSRS
jgi:hypothetical protein